jgi:hypothetical protein
MDDTLTQFESIVNALKQQINTYKFDTIKNQKTYGTSNLEYPHTY